MRTAHTKLFALTPAALALGAALQLAPTVASAAQCSITTSCERTTISEANKTRGRIEAMEQTVAEAVHQARIEIVEAIAGSSKTISDAVTNGSDAISENQADVEKRKEKTEAKKTRPPMQCGNTAGSQGPRGGGAGGAKKPSGPDGSYQPGSVSERWEKAMKESEQLSGVSVPPPAQAEEHKADLAVGGCETFADPNSVRGYMCRTVAKVQKGSSPFADADIKASTLFDGPNAKDSSIKNISIPSARSPERDARAAFLKMLHYASPLPTPPKSELETPTGKNYLGMRAEYDAAKSLAAYPSFEYDRLTTIDPATRGAVQQIQKEDGAFLAKYLSALPPSAVNDGAISPMLLMDLEVERRIGNEEWLKRMGAATEVEKAAEQLYIDAYSLRLQRDSLIAQQQTNVLLGKILDLMTEQEYRPKIEEVGAAMLDNKLEALKNRVTSQRQAGN